MRVRASWSIACGASALVGGTRTLNYLQMEAILFFMVVHGAIKVLQKKADGNWNNQLKLAYIFSALFMDAGVCR